MIILFMHQKNGEEIPPFYDDNVWLVIGLIKGYTLTNDEQQLDKAKNRLV